MFKGLIGKTIEVYVDYMIIKSKKIKDHAKDITEAFEILDKVGMKLNPNKCTFEVREGKFLGYMVSERA